MWWVSVILVVSHCSLPDSDDMKWYLIFEGNRNESNTGRYWSHSSLYRCRW